MIVSPKRSLGQHFLKDENIARKIIGYLNPEIPRVLEIGPGKGILTKYLLEDPAFDPLFIEIDRNVVAFLKEQYPSIRDRLIEADFLQFDLHNLIDSWRHQGSKASDSPISIIQNPLPDHDPFPRPSFSPTPDPSPIGEGSKSPSGDLGAQTGIQIIGNFPYNISSQILFRVIEYKELVGELVGMFQHEVAQRIASPPGSKQYGILSVLLQAYYDIEYMMTVNETVFQPPPKVKSAVIRLRRNGIKALDCDEAFFIRVVKTAFNQRRKMLRNSLRALAGSGFTGWDDPVMSQRPEQLSVEEFTRLTRLIRQGTAENF